MGTRDKLLYPVLAGLLAAILAVTGIMFSMALRYDQGCDWIGSTLEPISIQGEYSEEGGPWQPFSRETKFDYIDLRDITVRGRFTMDVPQGDALYMKIDQLWVKMRINGTEVLQHMPVPGDGNPTQAIGRLWYTFVSPGITTGDVVELQFGNLYRNAYFIQFDELLWDMRVGSERLLVREAIQEDRWLLGIGTSFLFLTLLMLVIALICVMLRITFAAQFLWLGLTSLFSALWFCTLSAALSLLCPWPVTLNLLYSYSIQGITVFVTLFVVSNVTGPRKRALLICLGTLMVMLLADMYRQIAGIQDLFSAINHFSLLDIAVAICIVLCLRREIACDANNVSLKRLLQAMLPLVALGVLELLNGYIQFCQAAICFGLGLISFVVLQSANTLQRIKRNMESEKRALLLENELVQSRVSMALSQIQPHFLYNALNTIHYLCRTQPGQAADAVKSFSEFLRGNMDSLSQQAPISFSHELQHLENYLRIQRLRFPDVTFAYDLQVTDFLLPALTLQPLVENAICYGATQGEEDGGTVTISTWEEEDGIFICVEDDGAGFDPAHIPQDGRSHIGLANTRQRVEAMCGGSLLVESRLGKGTRVTVSIPRKEALLCAY